MKVGEIVAALNLKVAAGAQGLDREITGGYASDLLSCVMARAAAGNVWVTLQAHPNVVAVADLIDLGCVIITENTEPNPDTLIRADEHGIPILLSAEPTYETVAQLVALGIT